MSIWSSSTFRQHALLKIPLVQTLWCSIVCRENVDASKLVKKSIDNRLFCICLGIYIKHNSINAENSEFGEELMAFPSQVWVIEYDSCNICGLNLECTPQRAIGRDQLISMCRPRQK